LGAFLPAVLGAGAPQQPAAPAAAAVPPSATTPPAVVRKAPAFAPYRVTRKLARGVELTQEVTPDGVPGGPLVVTVLRIDPREKGVRLRSALGYGHVWEDNATQGRERVSALAAREKALAAANSAFFTYSSGHPIGLFVTGGSLVTEPTMRRTVFGLTKAGKPIVATYDYKGTVEAEADADAEPVIALDGLNRKPTGAAGRSELLLFTPIFGARTLPAPGRVEAVLSGVGERVVPGRPVTARVEAVTEGGRTPLAPGSAVLSASGAAADWLRANAAPGKSLRLRVETPAASPGAPDAAELVEAVAGGPRLVTGGRVAVAAKEEGFPADFSDARHPRTAVGVMKDGAVLLLVVDGRQKTLSRGATLAETAALLVKFGAVDGVNLDGGGSTTLALGGSVVNAPSDNGSERPVAAALLVFAADAVKDDEVRPARATPAAPVSVTVGDTFAFGNVDKMGVTGAGEFWSAPGGVGFVAQDGRFFALRPGTGAVTRASLSGAKKPAATTPVTVAGTPPSLLPPEDPGAPQGGPAAGTPARPKSGS
jgi:uncharacterized protein YigE (DUF2233 family)